MNKRLVILFIMVLCGAGLATQSVKTVNGLAIASVKTSNQLAVASVKTVVGLDNTAASSLPLDNDTTNLVGAWSVSRRLLTSYTGPLVRIRDSTTTTEDDIGYDGSNLFDTADRDALISTHDATCTTIYDQTGAGSRDMAQATASKQPLIKTGGTVQTINGQQAIAGQASNSRYMATASVAHGIGSGDFFITMIVRSNSSLGMYQGLFCLGSYNLVLYSKYNTVISGYIAGVGLYEFSGSTFATSTNHVVSMGRESNTLKLWVNGVLQGSTFSAAGSLASNPFALFVDTSSGGDYSNFTICEAIIWKAIPTNAATIMDNQKTHAGL